MPPTSSQRVTRLAPSPTGALHLGNARSFLINWAMARRFGWRVVLRIEDLDTPRTKEGADEQAIQDLRWLGMDWDDGPMYQAHDLSPYREALDALFAQGLIYPCGCTRREIESAQSAPHADDHELRYPGTCRPIETMHTTMTATAGGTVLAFAPAEVIDGQQTDTAWRVRVPEEAVRFDDRIHGEQWIDVQAQVGDFVVASKNGLPAYQLAVVVDDARQGVTDIVRGDDLLRSTARQLWLYRLLRLSPAPTYWHLPLVLGPDGRRLAKRHGDTRLAFYRQQGVDPARIIGLIAAWSGAQTKREPMTAARFRESFDVDRLPRKPVTLTEEDHAWLLEAN